MTALTTLSQETAAAVNLLRMRRSLMKRIRMLELHLAQQIQSVSRQDMGWRSTERELAAASNALAYLPPDLLP
jgi:hypothetical protein